MAGRGKTVDPAVKLSKNLSYLLRHGAEKEGFKFLPGGFLYVDEILKHKTFRFATVDDIQYIVDTNDKKRFTLETESTTGRLIIRANQGHSLKVDDLDLQPISDPTEYPVLIHGTYEKPFRIIAEEGLRPMGRNHVHFAAGEPGEDGVISGMRSSCTVIIYLNLAEALKDGLKFYQSANNVILCPGNGDGVIPTTYFDKVIHRKTGKNLPFTSSSSPAAEETLIRSAETLTVTAEDIADEYDKRKNRRKNKHKKEN